jgi:hypothetical protein
MRNLFLNRSMSLVLLVACVAALAIAGCGGGDDSSSTPVASTVSGATGAGGAVPLSEDDFVSQANAICAEVNSDIEALTAPTNDLQSIADVTAQGIAIVKPALDQFLTLTPPADLADKWAEFLQHAQDQLKDEEALNAAATAGDTATVKSIANRMEANSGETDQIASEMGLTECAKDVQPQG